MPGLARRGRCAGPCLVEGEARRLPVAPPNGRDRANSLAPNISGSRPTSGCGGAGAWAVGITSRHRGRAACRWFRRRYAEVRAAFGRPRVASRPTGLPIPRAAGYICAGHRPPDRLAPRLLAEEAPRQRVNAGRCSAGHSCRGEQRPGLRLLVVREGHLRRRLQAWPATMPAASRRRGRRGRRLAVAATCRASGVPRVPGSRTRARSAHRP